MTQVTGNFETGVDGANVTTGDPGSATAWDAVVTAGTTTIKYSSVRVAHGSLSAQFSNISGASVYLEWAAAMGTTVNNYGRVYLWRDSLDTGSNHFWLSCYSSAAAFICRFFIDTTGKIQIQGSGGGSVATGTTTLATGQWTRLEYKIVNHTSAGVLEVKLFNTADSVTPDDTITATALDTRADTARLVFGSEQVNTAGYVYYMDDIVAGASGYPGPVTVPTDVLSMLPHISGHNVW